MSTGTELGGKIFGRTSTVYIRFTLFTKEIEDIQAATLLSLPKYGAGLKGFKFSKIFRLSVAQFLISNHIVFTKMGTQSIKGLFSFLNNVSLV